MSGRSQAEQDRYFAEEAQVAALLGAPDVPRSRADIDRYLAAQRPHLVNSERTREVVRLIMAMPVANPLLVPAVRTMADAGVALLPPWARQMLGLHRPSLRRSLALAGMQGLAPALRWALGQGLAARARRRAGARSAA